MIDRIAKLLNQAERAATPAEAEAFFDKAQALATAHSISLARARLHTQGRQRDRPVSKTIRVGEPRMHANRHLVTLLARIAHANDLRMDIARNSTFVILYGFPSDIAAAEEMWSRISTQMIRFGEQYLGAGAWRNEYRLVLDGRTPRRGRMTRQAARSAYYGSFIKAVGDRIGEARERSIREAERHDDGLRQGDPAAARTAPEDSGPETAVALRAKEIEVREFYQGASEARGSWSGGRSRVHGLSPSADRAGRYDARRAKLGSESSLPGTRRALDAQ